MKKISVMVACAVMALCAFPLTACKGGGERSSYEIAAEYFPESGVLSARMTASIFNATENAFSALPFQLWANAYRERAKYPPVADPYLSAAYYAGESYGGIHIDAVAGGVYSIGGEDENILTVTLPEPLYPDERAAVTVDFTLTLPAVNHRMGRGEHAVNLANFYPVLCPYGENGFLERVYAPCGDPFVSECADYAVTLRVPADFEVMGAEKRGEGEYFLEAENVRDVAFVIGKGFSRAETEEAGVKLIYAYFDDPAPTLALEAARKSFAFYSSAFSPYSYPVYYVVQTDLPYGGMEYPMLSMISHALPAEEARYVIAHETAHQWWYAMVGSDQFTEAWQDEGLAEYSVALLSEHDPSFGNKTEIVEASERAYRAFFSVSSQVNGTANTRMTRPLTDYGGLYEYRSVAYDKGVILFDRIRLAAGEKKFAEALSLYARRYAGKIASRADIVASFSAAGAHVGELFSSFLDGRCVI